MHWVEQWHNGLDSFTLHTSGSTGKPKSIEISRAAIQASVQATLKALDLGPGTRALLCLPYDKIAGFMMVVRALVGRWELWVTEPQKVPLEKADHFDFAAMVPYQAYASWPRLPQVNKLLIGGGAITPNLATKLKEYEGMVYHSYGMTETITHVALQQLAPQRQSFFQALPGVSFTADDRNCLVINAPKLQVHELVTNDVVDLRDAHSFVWRGRADHAITVAGSTYLPEEIEQQISWTSSAIMVTAVPHSTLGEQIALVLEQEHWPRPEELYEALQAVPHRQKPKTIYLLPNFEYTPNGKLQRAKTQELLVKAQPKIWPYT